MFPIDLGHIVLVQDNAHKDRLRMRDLEGALNLCFERKYAIWHNMEKAASTFHEEDHFQGMPGQFPIDLLELEQVDEERYIVQNYPGEHAVFTGYNCTLNAEKMIRKLDGKDIPHIILCSKGYDEKERIYVFPVRVPQGKGGCGGFEAGMNAVEKNKLIYNGLNNANSIESKLASVFYEIGNKEIL